MHNRIHRIAYSNNAELANGFADHAASVLTHALRKQQTASLVVPGGNTPRSYLPVLAAQPLPWSRITITLSDERWVDTDSEDSNERLVRKSLLDQLTEYADPALPVVWLLQRTLSPVIVFETD